MSYTIADIKKLRDDTGAGISEVKMALEEAAGDYEKAKTELMKKVGAKAAKKADRVTKDGLIYSYVHSTGKVGSLVYIACETDFVTRTDDFKKLCQEVSMQVSAGDYANVDELLADDYIRDSGKKIQDLVNELTAKVGEKIEIRKFAKIRVGDE